MVSNKSRVPVEEFELKCYKFPDCLLVNADKRCPISFVPHTTIGCPKVKATPLTSLADGRKYLDNSLCKPESLSKVRVVYDNVSDRVIERESSVCADIEQEDCQFLSFVDHQSASDAVLPESCKSELANEKIAEQLKNHSFVLVERRKEGLEHQADTLNEQPASQLQETDLEKEFLSSLEIKPTSLLSAHRKESEGEPYEEETKGEVCTSLGAIALVPAETALKPRRKQSSNWASKLNKWLGARKTSSPSVEAALPAGEERRAQNSPLAVVQSGCVPSMSNSPNPMIAMISYNHTEAKEYAVQLHSALERVGVRSFLDLYDIQSGADWQDSLNWAILNCRVFIPLVTRSYGETLWTRRECKLADVLAKRIIPVNFLQTKWPPPSLAIQFATLQYLDWRLGELARPDGTTDQWPTECVQSIASTIEKCVRLNQLIDQSCRLTSDSSMISRGRNVGSSSTSNSSSTASGCSAVSRERSEQLPRLQLCIDSGYDTPTTEKELILSAGNCSPNQACTYGSALPCSLPTANSPCDADEECSDSKENEDIPSEHEKDDQQMLAAAEKKHRKLFSKRAFRALSKVKRSMGMAKSEQIASTTKTRPKATKQRYAK